MKTARLVAARPESRNGWERASPRKNQRTTSSLPYWREGDLARWNAMGLPTDEERDWFTANVRLLSHLARQHGPGGEPRLRDCWGFLYPTVLLALRKYEPDRGTKLSSFVARFVRNQFGRYYSRYEFLRGPRGRHIPLGHKRPHLLGDRDLAEVEEHPAAETPAALRYGLMTTFASLPQRQRDILGRWLGLFGPRWPQRRLAAEYGITTQRVSQICGWGLRYLAEQNGLSTRAIAKLPKGPSAHPLSLVGSLKRKKETWSRTGTK